MIKQLKYIEKILLTLLSIVMYMLLKKNNK